MTTTATTTAHPVAATVGGVVLRRGGLARSTLVGIVTPAEPLTELQAKLRARSTLPPELDITFTGGRSGDHRVIGSVARVLAHWEGYCEWNNLGLEAGRWVRFHTSNAWRLAQVLVQPKATSKTVLVGPFRYKHGGHSSPRRWNITELTIGASVTPLTEAQRALAHGQE